MDLDPSDRPAQVYTRADHEDSGGAFDGALRLCAYSRAQARLAGRYHCLWAEAAGKHDDDFCCEDNREELAWHHDALARKTMRWGWLPEWMGNAMDNARGASRGSWETFCDLAQVVVPIVGGAGFLVGCGWLLARC